MQQGLQLAPSGARAHTPAASIHACSPGIAEDHILHLVRGKPAAGSQGWVACVGVRGRHSGGWQVNQSWRDGAGLDLAAGAVSLPTCAALCAMRGLDQWDPAVWSSLHRAARLLQMPAR